MAIQHVAGSRVFFGTGAGVADRGPLVTTLTLNQAKAIVDRTGIGSSRRQRHDAGLFDAGFDLAGFFDPDAFGAFGAGDGQDILLAHPGGTGARAFRCTGRISPEDSIEHPVGEMVRVSASGNFHGLLEGHVMLDRQRKQTRAQSSYTAADAGLIDRGAAAAARPSMLVQLDAFTATGTGGNIEVELLHAQAPGGPYADAVGAGTHVIIPSATAAAPHLFAWRAANSVAGLRRYLGVRVNTPSAAAVATLDMTFSVYLFLEV